MSQREWLQLMGSNPSARQEVDPNVENVSWLDAQQAFEIRLSVTPSPPGREAALEWPPDRAFNTEILKGSRKAASF
ncbi:MAG: hypothetical protein ABI693_02860 [Bryobacteraceae bacterium]